MIDAPKAADYTIWAVAFLLYVTDAVKLLAPRELLLVEAERGRFNAPFSDQPYTLGGRIVALGPILLPFRGVFVAAWGRPWIDDASLRAMVDRLAQLGRSLFVPRIIATLGL